MSYILVSVLFQRRKKGIQRVVWNVQQREVLKNCCETTVVKQIQVPVKVDNYDLIMELTTGTSVSLISEMTYNKLWTDQELF